jgi:membrane fusion protein, multidrug efflux system
MAVKRTLSVLLAVLALVGIVWGLYILIPDLTRPQFLLTNATRHDITIAVNTHGVIEPIDRVEIVAQIDGLVTGLLRQEGDEVTEGSLLLRLESQILTADLAEAQSALFQARAAARQIAAATPRENTAAEENSNAEAEFGQQIKELDARVASIEQEVQKGSVIIPKSGILYFLAVKKGDFANRGKLLAQVYEPGNVMLRVEIAESDMPGIERGQRVTIESYGMPGRHWTGVLDQAPQELMAQDNRMVGEALCLIDGAPKELTPNLNVRTQIIIAGKAAVLVVPKTAVFNHNGQPTVIVMEGGQPSLKPVTPGIVTAEEIEILQGVEEGSSVVTNPQDAK